MKKLIIGVASLGVMAGLAYASTDADTAIKARQAAMKEVGASAKAGDFAAINKAAVAAKAAFSVDTSKSGTAKTTALPAIWSDSAKFNGLMDRLIAGSAAGDKGATFGTCKECHASFRVKQ